MKGRRGWGRDKGMGKGRRGERGRERSKDKKGEETKGGLMLYVVL